MEEEKEKSTRGIIMSVQIVVSRRRFIVVRRISMPVCSEKGTSHCLVHKEESKKRDSDERNYFPRAKKSERRGAHETEGESGQVAPRR